MSTDNSMGVDPFAEAITNVAKLIRTEGLENLSAEERDVCRHFIVAGYVEEDGTLASEYYSYIEVLKGKVTNEP